MEKNSFEKKFAELKKKKEKAFVPFVVLGDPDFQNSFGIIKTLIDSGADALELGFAFSDPIADGPTIQEADQRALSKGIDTEKNFKLLEKITEYSKSKNLNVPISLLLYSNLILQYGIEKFYKKAKSVGVSAILASDVSLEESKPFVHAARKNKIEQIFLATQTTSNERLRKILKVAEGYVYLVSVMGITGARKNIQKETIDLIKRVKSKSRLPIVVGFGISSKENAKAVVGAGADGFIVGSAIVNLIKKNLNSRKRMLVEISKFCIELKKASIQ